MWHCCPLFDAVKGAQEIEQWTPHVADLPLAQVAGIEQPWGSAAAPTWASQGP